MKIRWHGLLVKMILLSCLSISPASAFNGLNIIEPAVEAPHITFTSGNGEIIDLSHFKGQVVVLNIWATWCPSCVKELPSFERLAIRMDGIDISVLAISQDAGGIDVVAPFLDKLGIEELERYTEPQGIIQKEFSTRGLPTTFILSKKGEVIGFYEGALEWDSPDIVDYLHQLLIK